MLTAGFVGYAGGLLTLMLEGVYANNLNWQHAGDSLLMAVLGGVHHFLGPLWGAIAFILLEDRLSAITENWWLIFAPILIVFALGSPEGIQGLVQRILGRQRWTLVRDTTPKRPAQIAPYASAAINADPRQPILQTRKLNKMFGSLVVAHEIDLDVHPFVLHSIIGPNGAGKTTFFNMLCGDAVADRRPDHFRRQGYHPASGLCAGADGHQPLVSDPLDLPEPDGVRECAHRGAGAAAWRQGNVLGCLWSYRDQRPDLVDPRCGRARRPCGRTLHQPSAWRQAAVGNRRHAVDRFQIAVARRAVGGTGRIRPRGGRRPDQAPRRQARRHPDRARHRQGAGDLRSRFGAAPGPDHRRRQADGSRRTIPK